MVNPSALRRSEALRKQFSTARAQHLGYVPQVEVLLVMLGIASPIFVKLASRTLFTCFAEIKS